MSSSSGIPSEMIIKVWISDDYTPEANHMKVRRMLCRLASELGFWITEFEALEWVMIQRDENNCSTHYNVHLSVLLYRKPAALIGESPKRKHDLIEIDSDSDEESDSDSIDWSEYTVSLSK